MKHVTGLKRQPKKWRSMHAPSDEQRVAANITSKHSGWYKIHLLGLWALCMVALAVNAHAQSFSLTGDPVITTGWNIGWSAHSVDTAMLLTDNNGSERGYVYYNTPVTVTTCGFFSADFDYLITPTGGVNADGLAFFFSPTPPSPALSSVMGLAPTVTGLVLTMDTYDNDGDGQNPEYELLGYTTPTVYNEGTLDGNAADHLTPLLGNQNYMDDGNWHHVKILYNAGNITVFLNGSTIPSMTGYFPMSLTGYFGLSASTGSFFSVNQMVKNIVVQSSPSANISGIPAICTGPGGSTSLSDSTAGGTWSSDNLSVAVVDPASGIVTGVSLGTATISYSGTNGCVGYTVTQVLTVNPVIAGITGSGPVCGGGNILLSDATPFGSWKSSNAAVATIDTVTGNVTGIAGGTTVITYTADYCQATQVVTVAPPVAISVPTDVYISTSVTFADASPGGVWSSSNPAVLPIDAATGVASPDMATGAATITYSLGSCYVTEAVSPGDRPYCNQSDGLLDIFYTFKLSLAAASTLNDSTVSNAGLAYEDRRDAVAVTNITNGATYTVSLTGYGIVPMDVQVWIDINDDGIFESSETVGGANADYSRLFFMMPVTFSITIPPGVMPGLHTMRIRTDYNDGIDPPYPNFDPCSGFDVGEVMDYYVNEIPQCMPAIVSATGNTLLLDSTTTLTDAVPGGVWTSNNTAVAIVDATGMMTGIAAGAVTVSYTTASCTDTFVMTVTGRAYCAPLYSQNADVSFIADIEAFSLTAAYGAMLTDVPPAMNLPGYYDRRSVVSPVRLTPDSSYTATVATGDAELYSYLSQNFQVWIDFNNNGTFESSETVGGANGVGLSASFGITVPAGVPAGLYTMRVRSGVYFTTSPFPGMDPCGDNTYGETLDYFITVNSNPAFTGGPAQSLTACGRASDISALLQAADPDPGQTETWTVYSAPAHGSVTTGTTQLSNGGNVTPSGFSYTPVTGFSGTDVFTIQVSDGDGGTATTVINVTVNPTPAITSITANNISCNTANDGTHNDGSITTVVSGASGYSYVWTGGAAGANPTGLAAGTYTITVTADNGCSATASATVGQPSPEVLSASIGNVGCHGGIDGYINADVSGGTPGYSYSWHTGGAGLPLFGAVYFATAGVYSVTATDAHGCKATAAYTLTQPDALSITATAASVNCHGGSDGSINTTVAGGTPVYNYLWSNGSHAADPAGLSAGTYSVIVTDAHFCITTGAYTVAQPAALSITAVATSETCHGGANGSINTTASGGTLPYTYLWSNGAVAADPASLAAGTYSVTVTDAHSCTASGSYAISQPAAISVTAVTTAPTCNGGSNGSINTTVANGTPAYSYVWSNGSHLADPAGLTAGTYSVTVTDLHNCTATSTYTVSQPSAISIAATVVDVSCNGNKNGSITTTVSGGTAGYSYTWSNGAHTASLTGLAQGTYTLTVTDAHGCTAAHGYTVNQPAVLSLTATVVNASCYACSNGSINTTVAGGTIAYSYTWSNGSHAADPVSLVAGTYSVTVTDANGCTAKGAYTVAQPAKGRGARTANGGDDSTTAVTTPPIMTEGIVIYPNPTDNFFNVEIPVVFKEAQVLITDLTGRIIDSRIITDNTGQPVQFSLNNVAKGVYLVKVITGDASYVGKVIVK